jgi:hypothetical protein
MQTAWPVQSINSQAFIEESKDAWLNGENRPLVFVQFVIYERHQFIKGRPGRLRPYKHNDQIESEWARATGSP